MLLSVVDAVFGRLPVEPSVLSAFFDSALAFLFGFLMIYLFARYLLKPVAGWLLKYREIVVEPAVRQLVLQLIGVSGAIIGIWVGLHFAGAAGVISGTATIISAGTLAIGVASRDIISNLTNGLFLIANPQFEVGDWVEWSDNEGVVEEIGIRVSRIRTFENRTIVVPNSELGNSALTNHDDKDRIKIVIPVGVGYGEDLAVVKKVAVDEALKIDGVMRDPLPGVSVVGLGASWVDLKVAIWIDDSNHTAMIEARDELVSRIKARFRDENISMPAKKQSVGGQIQVANIDSDKLSPAEETKIQDPAEIDLPVDVSEIEQGKQESDGDLASSFTTAVENAVDFQDDDGTAESTGPSDAGKARGSNGDKRSNGGGKEDLVVGEGPSENDGESEKSKQDGSDN